MSGAVTEHAGGAGAAGPDQAAPAPVAAEPALLSGVEALARLLVVRAELDARDGLTTATMVSGYPGSPLGTFDLTIERAAALLTEHRVLHRPGLNEELAAATVWGSQMGAGRSLLAPGSAEAGPGETAAPSAPAGAAARASADDGSAPRGAALPEGGALDGVVGAWYGKTPGLDRCGDVLKHAGAMGTGPNGGVVMFCGDDPSAKSSTLACDSQYTFEDACVPVLVPGDQQDILDLGVHAFRMSRYSGAWAGLKIVTSVADGIGTVDAGVDRHTPSDPTDHAVDGRPWRHIPSTAVGPHAAPGQEEQVIDLRLRAAEAYARHNRLDRVVGAPAGARLGVVCAGKTYFDVVQAFADLGVGMDRLADVGVRVLRLAVTYPLGRETVLEFARSVDEIVVIEEKRPFVETQLRAILHEAGLTTRVAGKRDRDGRPLVTTPGELDASKVAAVLRRVLPDLVAARAAATANGASNGSPARRLLPVVTASAPAPVITLPLVDLPARPPGFCSGCPHNRSTVFPEGALVGGGVGCHGIMYFEARHLGMKSLPPTPMGAEGVPWLGLSPFVDEPHLIQNLGDGTLSHSGILAIRASVAAGVNVTFKILYNTAVAMTGGQDVVGLMDVPAMTRALEAEGVTRVVVCAEDPKHYGRRARFAPGVRVLGRDHLEEVQEELRSVPGVTTIIYDQRCAAESRRLRKRGLLPEPPRRVVINEAVCEGCGDCSVKSNCLSVLPHHTEFGEKRRIDDLSCNRDYTCLEGDCPSFVTITPRKPGPLARLGAGRRAGQPAGKNAASHVRPHLPAGDLPAPDVQPITESFGVYFTGVGGTGVVTANRVIAAAAQAAGLAVAGLDQTGLSQKAGAVVSHLRLSPKRAGGAEAAGASTVGEGGADLYLSGDILQAAAAKHLATVRPGRTVAVVDVTVTPTAAMLQRDVAAPDEAVMRAAVSERVGDDRALFLDSKRIAEQVFANQLLGNIVLLGAAYQLGGLPLPLADLEKAMGRNGKAVADNRAAFAWGRWAAHDPAAVEAALAATAGADTGAAATAVAKPSIFDPSPGAFATAGRLVAESDLPAGLPDDLRALLVRRAAQAIDYQDAGRAARFLGLVATAAGQDGAGHGWALTRAVAESWFKLLTYKDEYEVARLHLLADHAQTAADLGIEGPYKVTYHLHPPSLRRMGLKHKLPAARPWAVMFHGLRTMRRLRGTPFDVFGLDRDRRLERAVIREYEALVTGSLAAGRPYADLVSLAESAQMIKGYESIKAAAVERWRAQVAPGASATAGGDA
ncbi:indolepyruvate ferredoxin oxidoreductase family protein [Pseudofrankia sp. BMG5.36]|uniref:indolepyruvate ferredoxin oxidoreductase family protein n=1 Tax=Pseudofrankia sp. BMG5.36 TaxID=1834512 RepID=UPI0009F4C04F|nr:indolepyruvate ferredoxin oxidoreductase family protein [Pseudofrankia sp. BMG5.36]